ncbi:hypothetical protein Bca52824_095825 [Brassica carinata]|uniref:Replication protein A 70 kDa DNA-binding subunit B/D first OB fold domain-containing protein n=1 Tax=Brassica carinata TaxID=52824 RepID=A0A8X7P1U6_BRACI|nr:hypothetical protein Bca52824_095825 [Brassica carinata]
MSKPSTKVLIDGVKPVRHNWQIRVKVLHSWKQTTAFAGNTLEFILADETGVKIAASCKRNQISRLYQLESEKQLIRLQFWVFPDSIAQQPIDTSCLFQKKP